MTQQGPPEQRSPARAIPSRAFNRLAARDTLMVDAKPERLGVELVNRYRAVKRAELI